MILVLVDLPEKKRQTHKKTQGIGRKMRLLEVMLIFEKLLTNISFVQRQSGQPDFVITS